MVPCPCPAWVFPAAAGLLAAPRLEGDLRLVYNTLYIVAALLLGAIVIAVVNRWRRGSRSDSLSPSDLLTQYRSLYEEGAISQEEFERLRSLLSRRIRDRSDAPPPKAARNPETGAIESIRPPESTNPENPSGPTDPPETGIRPA